MSYDDALLIASLMVIMAGITAAINSHYYFVGACNANRVRAAVCNLLYKKSLRLSQRSLHDTSPGKFVNLLSGDVSRTMSTSIHYLWVSPLATAFALYFLWQELQWPAFLGAIIFFVVLPLQSEFGKEINLLIPN